MISPVPSFGSRSATCDRSGRPRPPHDDDDEDHEERRHAVEPGDDVLVEKRRDVAAVERGHRLADADDQAAEQRQRERVEPAEQRRAETGDGHHDRERDAADSPVSGAASTAAKPPSIPPSVHVSAARRSGDHPSVCTARSFWALALMASPTRV